MDVGKPEQKLQSTAEPTDTLTGTSQENFPLITETCESSSAGESVPKEEPSNQETKDKSEVDASEFSDSAPIVSNPSNEPKMQAATSFGKRAIVPTLLTESDFSDEEFEKETFYNKGTAAKMIEPPRPSLVHAKYKEVNFKVLLIGEPNAGKTSIVRRYVHDVFREGYRATIGVDLAHKTIGWDEDTVVRLQLWDTAGEEKTGLMLSNVFYRHAAGAFIVYDVTKNNSLDRVVRWKKDLDIKVSLPDGKPIPCILLANKCDKLDLDMVEEGISFMDSFCKDHGFYGWFQTSAKENRRIEVAVNCLITLMLQYNTGTTVIPLTNRGSLNDDSVHLCPSPDNFLRRTCNC